MLMVISPAKTLDFAHSPRSELGTQPQMLTESAQLVDLLKTMAPQHIAELMHLSDKLSQLNVARYQAWQLPFTRDNAKPAVLAFKGDVYTGLDADTLSDGQLQQAQQQLCILSGLYGVLRPLDLMQAYRLEMGTKLHNSRGADLYHFWGNLITDVLNQHIKANNHSVLVNLASQEYFKAVNIKQLSVPVVTPVFKDWKNGQYKIISFYAKKARGLMVRYALDHQLNEPEALKGFDYEGYVYNDSLSTAQQWVFTRDH